MHRPRTRQAAGSTGAAPAPAREPTAAADPRRRSGPSVAPPRAPSGMRSNARGGACSAGDAGAAAEAPGPPAEGPEVAAEGGVGMRPPAARAAELEMNGAMRSVEQPGPGTLHIAQTPGGRAAAMVSEYRELQMRAMAQQEREATLEGAEGRAAEPAASAATAAVGAAAGADAQVCSSPAAGFTSFYLI